jgi:hypothetical protein
VRLRPLEWDGVGVVRFDKAVDGLTQLRWRCEAGVFQRSARKNAEPALDLVHPAGMSGREVEVNIGMA